MAFLIKKQNSNYWWAGRRDENGNGVLQDQTRAHVWNSLAGANGNEIGIENRDSLAKKLTSDQIAEAQKMAQEMVAANPKLIGE